MVVRNRIDQGPTQRGANDAVTRRAKDGRKPVRWPAYAGSRLKLDAVLGRPRLKGQPSSRTGENSPYGMIGGIEETSASFEARSAPRSYPALTVPSAVHLAASVHDRCWHYPAISVWDGMSAAGGSGHKGGQRPFGF